MRISATMSPWRNPLWPSVDFTGRSVESQNRSLLPEDAVGTEEVAGLTVTSWAERPHIKVMALRSLIRDQRSGFSSLFSRIYIRDSKFNLRPTNTVLLEFSEPTIFQIFVGSRASSFAGSFR
jgi:hypothetical protein